VREEAHVVADGDLPQLGKDLPSSRTCRRMQLLAATKPTSANFDRVIRKQVQSLKVVTNDSIGTCSSGFYFPPTETSGIAWCGNVLNIFRNNMIQLQYLSAKNWSVLCSFVTRKKFPSFQPLQALFIITDRVISSSSS